MGRRIGICSVCAEEAQAEMGMDQPVQAFIDERMEEKELLAHGMCAKHYRRYEREKNADPLAAAARHEARFANEQKKFRKALMQIWNALDELVGLPFMPEMEVIRMRGIIQPYWKRMVDGLSTVKLSPVNIHPKKSRERSLAATEQAHTKNEGERSQEPQRADGAATD
jgi:hypothetical protein